MGKASEVLGKTATAKTAQGEFYAQGKVIAYCEAPTVTIELPDGSQVHWRLDLCEIKTNQDKKGE
jgi:hypothetical protein